MKEIITETTLSPSEEPFMLSLCNHIQNCSSPIHGTTHGTGYGCMTSKNRPLKQTVNGNKARRTDVHHAFFRTAPFQARSWQAKRKAKIGVELASSEVIGQ